MLLLGVRQIEKGRSFQVNLKGQIESKSMSCRWRVEVVNAREGQRSYWSSGGTEEAHEPERDPRGPAWLCRWGDGGPWAAHCTS